MSEQHGQDIPLTGYSVNHAQPAGHDLPFKDWVSAYPLRDLNITYAKDDVFRRSKDTITVLIAQSSDRPSFLRRNGRWTACKTITVDMTTEELDVSTGDQWRRFEPGPRHFRITAVDVDGREHRIETDRDEDRRTGGVGATITNHETCVRARFDPYLWTETET